jgi:hypothetical protein
MPHFASLALPGSTGGGGTCHFCKEVCEAGREHQIQCGRCGTCFPHDDAELSAHDRICAVTAPDPDPSAPPPPNLEPNPLGLPKLTRHPCPCCRLPCNVATQRGRTHLRKCVKVFVAAQSEETKRKLLECAPPNDDGAAPEDNAAIGVDANLIAALINFFQSGDNINLMVTPRHDLKITAAHMLHLWGSQMIESAIVTPPLSDLPPRPLDAALANEPISRLLPTAVNDAALRELMVIVLTRIVTESVSPSSPSAAFILRL